jgi:hypothetical protein
LLVVAVADMVADIPLRLVSILNTAAVAALVDIKLPV